MSRIKMAVVGVGTIGTAHASCIYNGEIDGMELCALCDSDKERVAELREEFKGIPIYESYEELLKSGVCDGVIVSTPHYLHPIISKLFLENNCHVLCEKPIGVYTKGLCELIEAERGSGKKFAVMLNQRTNKLFVKAKELIKNGEIGEITESVWIITNWYRTQEYYDSSSWRGSWQGEGGGVLMNQAPHNLDLWQWLCGMPKRVMAHCYEGKHHTVEVEDEAVIYAEYENGANGTFITSTGNKYGTNRLEITGKRGKILLEKGTLTIENEDGTQVICDEEYNGHKNILQNFANAILYNEKLISPAQDAINQLKLCNASYLSSWKGEWVNLDFDSEEYLNFLKLKVEKSQVKGAKKSKNLFDKSYKERWGTKW